MITHQWTHPSSFTPFDLTPADLNGKVWLSSEGIEGMGMPEFDDFTREAPLLDGQSFQGWRAKPREVFWPVVIDGMKGTEFGWNTLQSAFWKSMRPGVPGVWRVTGPSGYRELSCRFRSDGGAKYGIDPTRRKIEKHGVTLTADDPWWRGAPVTQSISSRTNYYPNPVNAAAVNGLHAGATVYTLGSVTGNMAIVAGWQQLTTTTVGANTRYGFNYQMPIFAVAGQQISFAVDYINKTGPANGRVYIDAYGAGGPGVPLGHGDVLSAPSGAGTMSGTFTATGTVTMLNFWVWLENTTGFGALGSSIQVARTRIELAPSPGTFFYGDQVSPGFSYYWQGAANASPSTETPNISMTNVGDVAAWPKYRLNGPATAFRVTPYGGLAAQGVGGSILVPAGEHLLVDTDPTVQTAMLSSGGGTTYTDVTTQLTAVWFFPFEPGSGAYASQVMIIGGGTMVATIIPGYYRAF